MPTQSWRAADFLGLTPAIDPRRSDKLFAIGGQNYLFDSIGPKSGFGNRLVTPFKLGKPAHVEGFRISTDDTERAFTLTQDSVLEWSETLGGWKILYVLPTASEQAYRWTHAYLNGILYMCHPRCGILCLDITTDLVTPLREEGCPTTAIAICLNNARLIAIDTDTLYWSGPSNGKDWHPRLAGAGFQKIKNHVSGNGISVSSFGKGVITWTSGGVMRSDFTGEQYVFTHKALNTEYQPINSFCIQQVDDSTVVILDQRGLFRTQGQAPEPYAPMFNEYLIEFIRLNRLDKGVNVRLEWDNLRRLMFLSYSLSWENPTYEAAFVYYPPMDKWGIFNEEHYGILPVRFDLGDRGGDFFGFVDAKGRHHYWSDGGNRETAPTALGLNPVYPRIQVANHIDRETGGRVCSTVSQMGATPEMLTAKPAGFFAPGGTVSGAPQLVGLDSRIVLGLLTFDLGEAVDQLTEVSQVTVGSSETARDGSLAQGLPVTDWTQVTIAPDQGLSPRNPAACQVRILSTLDGRSVWDSATAIETYVLRNQRYYSCLTQGLYHMLELTASLPGDYFHLGSFSLTASYAGKLQ